MQRAYQSTTEVHVLVKQQKFCQKRALSQSVQGDYLALVEIEKSARSGMLSMRKIKGERNTLAEHLRAAPDVEENLQSRSNEHG